MTNQLDLLASASIGFDHLFNNELDQAIVILSSITNSPFHQVGLGLTKFLEAALGLEDEDLYSALNILIKGEQIALNQPKRSSKSIPALFGDGNEYKVLVGDATLCQALVHILTESYVEFIKAVYKLNRAYKAFSQVYKVVFPAGVTEEDSVADIINQLNQLYLLKIAESKELEPTGMLSLLGWGKKKAIDPATLRHSSSTTALPSLVPPPPIGRPHAGSMPNSRPPSIPDKAGKNQVLPVALWKDDPLSSFVIGGAAFGQGLFVLILSLLPPKIKKVIGWIGFSNTNRSVALKLLTLAAASDDVHGYFASLALVTYYCIILLMSGYQADQTYLISQCESALSRVETKFPSGTLWILNRAKISRMKHDTVAAIATLEAALEKGTTFRQADSLLVFELSWCYLSEGLGVKAAESFLKMRELSTWSHSTYVIISAGALLDLPIAERTPETIIQITKLFDVLPSLFGMKRLMGDPPTTDESSALSLASYGLFIARKLASYKAKHARWITQGRMQEGSNFWEVIRVSPAAELAHFWNTNGRASAGALHKQIARLSAYSPRPKFDPTSSSTSPTASPDPSSPAPSTPTRNGTPRRATSNSVSSQNGGVSIISGGGRQASNSISSTKSSLRARAALPIVYDPNVDLDSHDEIAVRDLLLGTCYRALGTKDDLRLAKLYLDKVLEEENGIVEERWCVAFAMFELAVLACNEAETRTNEMMKEGGAGDRDQGVAAKKVWKEQFDEANRWLDVILTPGVEFDLKSRLESRGIMLQNEIKSKLASLGMA